MSFRRRTHTVRASFQSRERASALRSLRDFRVHQSPPPTNDTNNNNDDHDDHDHDDKDEHGDVGAVVERPLDLAASWLETSLWESDDQTGGRGATPLHLGQVRVA